jgi:hypothetical protein
MTGFVQIIEWSTSKIDEVMTLNEEWRDRFPAMGPNRVLLCGDRDETGRFLTVVEFDSYEAAMKNSEDPATSEFAERMAALCDGPPVFHNLNVIHEEHR